MTLDLLVVVVVVVGTTSPALLLVSRCSFRGRSNDED